MYSHSHATKKRKERDGGLDAPIEPSFVAAAPAGNRLLAGYLAHEFLTSGTLFGQMWDPARSVQPVRKPEPVMAYADVAVLLKGNGAHIPGVVNPTQLARWLQS
ncbi:uncharacterized protein LOC110112863 [Dendrobium catenatum]|uniref:Embryo sac development arrest 6 n=1 Tax=Dendrobium catenatum TaxID=906689 RepID=A0A2I0VGX3_9ASPA|nr:uncharacterized protein LOC110112863 [Dendrobium catenatum]PKU62643.1 hypothetical protein MA16_Dca016591 [Dendrobium catenatum]